MKLSQLVVERDSTTEESQGLQKQLDNAKAMVRRAHEELMLFCVFGPPDGASSCLGGENGRKS